MMSFLQTNVELNATIDESNRLIIKKEVLHFLWVFTISVVSSVNFLNMYSLCNTSLLFN